MPSCKFAAGQRAPCRRAVTPCVTRRSRRDRRPRDRGPRRGVIVSPRGTAGTGQRHARRHGVTDITDGEVAPGMDFMILHFGRNPSFTKKLFLELWTDIQKISYT
jgi:hypothetical protein